MQLAILLFITWLWLGFLLGTIVLPVIALVDILKHNFTGSDKIIWVLIVLFLPFVGSILYFVIGSKQKTIE
ncbi:PLDc N-terminal domain-containing protein [Salmonirosea aquatica]|uniref:Cardiolipin synthase N-terminal domain-containing protein n=1 Tax=Salmonirosea aquatica TaxID=2654236 RepID=A0A7C9FDQ0_9BACT|nr:hypothetical protein [Cytophagaceae bacterium SJW1-29]